MEDVYIIKDYLGSVYWPEYGINNIGDITNGWGYQIKMETETILNIEGSLVPYNYNIPLESGWSIIGYLHQNQYSVEEMIAGVENDLYILKDSYGSVYWPEYTMDNIVFLTPGEGYQIKLNNDTELIYPGAQGRLSTDLYHQFLSDRYDKPHNTGNNMTLAIPSDIWLNSPELGDEIVVFDKDGLIVGNAPYREAGSVITIWGDDILTREKDGLKVGEELRIYILRKSNNNLEKLTIHSWREGVGFYTVDGISIAGSLTQEIIQEKQLIRVVDVLGRNISSDNRQSAIYIYDDGSVEKKYIVK